MTTAAKSASSPLRVHAIGASSNSAHGWAWIDARGRWASGAASDEAGSHAQAELRALAAAREPLDIRTSDEKALRALRFTVERAGSSIRLTPSPSQRRGAHRVEILHCWAEALARRAAEASLVSHRSPLDEESGRFPVMMLRHLPHFDARSGRLACWITTGGHDIEEVLGTRLTAAMRDRNLLLEDNSPAPRAGDGHSPFYDEHGRWDLIALHEHCLPRSLENR